MQYRKEVAGKAPRAATPACLSAKADVPSEVLSRAVLYFFEALVSLAARSFSRSRLLSSSFTLLRNSGLSCRSEKSRLPEPRAAGNACGGVPIAAATVHPWHG